MGFKLGYTCHFIQKLPENQTLCYSRKSDGKKWTTKPQKTCFSTDFKAETGLLRWFRQKHPVMKTSVTAWLIAAA